MNAETLNLQRQRIYKTLHRKDILMGGWFHHLTLRMFTFARIGRKIHDTILLTDEEQKKISETKTAVK
jgi:hypothetical protein